MNVIKKWSPVAFVILAVAALGVLWYTPPAEAGGKCPKIYAPVVCDNGKTYVNQCVADRHHASGCVPTGEVCSE